MITKRKILLLSAVIIIAIVSLALYFILFKRSVYDGDFSYTYMGYGFSSQGVILQPNTGDNKSGYLHFIDLKSGYDIPLCTIPNCRHNNDDCFAHVLADPANSYQNILIYDTKLYYTQTRSEFQGGDITYHLDIYESTLQGDKISKLATFDGYSAADSVYIQNGYLFAAMSKDEVNVQNDNILSQAQKFYSMGVVNLVNKKSFQTPEKKGFNCVMLLLGSYKDAFYYEFVSTDAQENVDSKLNIYEYNYKLNNEKIWDDEYCSIDGNDFIYFKIVDNRMIILKPSVSFDQYTVSSVNLSNHSKAGLGSFEYGASWGFSPYIMGDKIFINLYSSDGMTALSNRYYDLVTKQKETVTGFTEYSIVNRIKDILILYDEKNGQYAAITVNDYADSNKEGITVIRQPVY